jgi:NAD(P)-dependent dehydrogenase (short-subunit alcohol dehydrogenase family)
MHNARARKERLLRPGDPGCKNPVPAPLHWILARLTPWNSVWQARLCSSPANLDRALAALPGAVCFAADLIDADAAAAMVTAVETWMGPVDVLVNSAGAARRMPPEELTPQAWRAAMDSKYFSYINVLDPLVKLMAERGQGVIVNVIGVGGKVASPVHLAGGAANAVVL